MRTLAHRLVRFSSALPAIFALACNDGAEPNATDDGEPGDGVFESANPSGDLVGGRDANLSGGDVAGEGAAPPGGPTASDDDGAGRAIEEADIIKVVGDKLYALSQYGGLSVIDVGTRDKLTLLGRHKVVAQPFEMYVRDDIVFAMYQGYGEYVRNEADDSMRWVQSSHVVVLDTTDPEHIVELSKFAVPGFIADSRIVGNILYVASFEDGSCWGCAENKPQTTLVSLDITAPTAVSRVQGLTFEERLTDAYTWRRSLMATDQRIYVAGPTWGNNGPVGSNIQVIDISDPTGRMVLGDTVQVEGQINSRWQMDEYDGTLRTVSQSFNWDPSSPPPHIQTFAVASSTKLTPLANVAMTIPQQEQLQSVRFDGTRGYVITFEQTDPLFTLDLTDPENPVQVGELVMPGFLYHMEPRGDRLLGLGFDQGNAAGSVNVSLFDVSDLATPIMLDRANFGGDWGWATEDQDRIHKAFNIDADNELILVPFSGYTQTDDFFGCGSWKSGVQLVDWSQDTLEASGVAPTKAQARRGFIHDTRLFAMSDERVEAFDITDRAAPTATAALPLARNITTTAAAGEQVVRIGQNWWSGVAELDLTSLANVTSPLGESIEVGEVSNTLGCGYGWLQSVVPSGERVHLVTRSYTIDEVSGKEDMTSSVTTVDVSSGTPKIAGTAKLDLNDEGYYGWGWGMYGLYNTGAAQVAINSTLIAAKTRWEYDGVSNKVVESSLQVADLSDANSPSVATIDLPAGLGSTGLVTSGSVVARSHYELSPANNGLVRFYLDRVDVSDAKDPIKLPALNIPGSLLAYDHESQRAITLDYLADIIQDITAEKCYERGNARFVPINENQYDYTTTKGSCVVIHYALNLVELGENARRLGRIELEEGENIGQIAISESRVFISLAAYGGYGYGFPGGDIAVGATDCFDCGGFYAPWFNTTERPLLTISGLHSGSFKTGRLSLSGGDYWSSTPIAASGERAVLANGWRGKLSVIDATDAEAPRLVRDAETSGYVQSLTIVGDTAVASMGMDGVQTIELAE